MVCKINHTKNVRCTSEIKDKALDPNSFLRLSYNCNRHTLAGSEKFKHFLWTSSSPIFLAQGHFLLVLVEDFVRGRLAWALTHWARVRLEVSCPEQENLLVPDYRTGFFFKPRALH